jgi:hypothetical protein
MIIILALQPVPRKLKLLSNIPSLTRIVLISPCVAKSDLKINAYDTSDVAHGKNTHVRKSPLNLRCLLLSNCASKIASTSMIGTSIIKYRNVFPIDLLKTAS